MQMKYIFVLLLVMTGSLANAQTAEDSVKAAVNSLFEGMKNADPTAIKNAFADSAILQTIINGPNGKITVRTEPVTAFENSISKLAKGAADERIEFGSVKVDGALASVWTPYKFYYNGNFSHCGANSFQLIRVNGSWKIQYLIDTRRRQGCN
jgi:hypothetical protein